MNKRTRLLISLTALTASIAPLTLSADILGLDTFVVTGAREANFTGASTTGGTLEYLDNSVSGRNDTGMVAPISSGSLTPFTQVGDTMTYSFHQGSISAANNLFTPLYRVGFDFGSTAALRYATSTGTGPRLEFGSNTNGNPFASGTVHVTHQDWTTFDFSALRFDEGNEVDAVVSLELVGINSGLYDYQMTVTYQSTISTSVSNTKTYTFTGVDGNEVVSLFHVTNSAGMITGDAYTISNASLEFTAVPEPSTFVMVSGLLVLGMVFLRRRKSRT